MLRLSSIEDHVSCPDRNRPSSVICRDLRLWMTLCLVLPGMGLSGCSYLGLDFLSSKSTAATDESGAVTDTGAVPEAGATPSAAGATDAALPGAPLNGAPLTGTTTMSAGSGGSLRGQRPLMIGTFNVQRFGESKMGKPDVMKHLRELALPFDVLAIQEVVSKDVKIIQEFVTKLNDEYNVQFNYITSPWLGDTSYKERYAFIYDTSRLTLLEQPFVLSDPENKLHREPLVARFAVRADESENPFTFVLVNVHTDPDVAVAEMDFISDLVNVLQSTYAGQEDDLMILGDFNLDPKKIFEDTKFAGRTDWASVLDPTVMTNTAGTKSYHNILFSPSRTEEFLNRKGVINFKQKFALTDDSAKEISDHMPVWAAFSLTESATRVADASPVVAPR